MFRKRAAVTVSTLVLTVAALLASSPRVRAQSQNQSVPDLTGTWELVEDHSALKMKLKDAGFPRVTVVIAQEGSQIRITQKQIKRGTQTEEEYSYYTDGRGETNLGRVELYPRYVAKFESVSGWEKERLLIKFSTEHLRWFGRGVSDSWVTRKDEWRLGSYGGTLILTISTVQSVSPGLYVGATYQSQTVTRAARLEKRKLVFSRR
jgi:hypothetical protein